VTAPFVFGAVERLLRNPPEVSQMTPYMAFQDGLDHGIGEPLLPGAEVNS
jgi:hypothetical protein